MGSRWGGCLAFVIAIWTTIAATGCNTHQCDPSTVVITQDTWDAGGVTALGEDGLVQWQSNPIDGPWLDFPGQRTYTVYFPQPFASPPEISIEIAADLSDAQSNFVVGPGNLAQLSAPTRQSITILNPSCAEYGLRVVATGLRAPALPAEAGDDESDDSPSE